VVQQLNGCSHGESVSLQQDCERWGDILGLKRQANIILLTVKPSVVSQKFIEEQQQILRLTTPRLKSTPGAPFAQDDSNFLCCLFQDDSNFGAAYYDSNFRAVYFRMTAIIGCVFQDDSYFCAAYYDSYFCAAYF
jgi:hypothetical protein